MERGEQDTSQLDDSENLDHPEPISDDRDWDNLVKFPSSNMNSERLSFFVDWEGDQVITKRGSIKKKP